MRLMRDEFEAKFQVYRAFLSMEIGRFWDSAAVLRQIGERTQDHLPEINTAPAFFRTVQSALFTTIVLWADKLFDEHGARGLFDFLTFVEYNRDWLSVGELQRRKGYPDGHWMLQNREPITLDSINADREKIRNLAALKSIRIRRDKFDGHFDRDYFFDRQRLHDAAPIMWKDVDEAADVMGVMLNNYSADFDGELHAWQKIGIDDLSRLLYAASKGRR
jgi:hypothetical protein